MRHLLFAGAAAAVVLAAPAAHAGASAELLRAHAEAGTLAVGEAELAARLAADPRDQETRFALGAAQFVRAFEKLGQGIYRYGLTSANGPQGAITAPLEIGVNPSPAPLDYAAMRLLLDTYVSDLDRAAATLEGVTSRSVKLPMDLAAIRLDLDGDGAPDAGGEAIFGGRAERAIIVKGQPPARPQRLITFDLADAIWMRGYANLFAAPMDFILAHDFEDFFNVAMPQLFPAANIPAASLPYVTPQDSGGFGGARFMAAIEAVHLLSWNVAEPERRARVRQRLLAVAALSRQNLAAINRERDDDHEWLPNARQTSPFASLDVTNQQLAAWRGVLDLAEDVLNGEKLIPHPRFTQGVDVRAFFDEPRRFDLVTLFTGAGVAPYLKEGPVVSQQEFNALREAMGPNAFLFAAWFN